MRGPTVNLAACGVLPHPRRDRGVGASLAELAHTRWNAAHAPTLDVVQARRRARRLPRRVRRREHLEHGAELALRVYMSPIPIVLGITGHALAMGGILATTADYRIGADGPFKLGLNEVAIGMPVGSTCSGASTP